MDPVLCLGVALTVLCLGVALLVLWFFFSLSRRERNSSSELSEACGCGGPEQAF